MLYVPSTIYLRISSSTGTVATPHLEYYACVCGVCTSALAPLHPRPEEEQALATTY
jgi:hypothetical protein